MNWIIGRITSGLKWLLLLAAIGGPVGAYLSWDEATRMREVQANGIETEAVIEGATETTRKGNKSYKVDLSWTGQDGKAFTAKDISITDGFARKITANGALTESNLKIKYIAGSPDHDPIVLDDVNEQIATDDILVPVGIAAGVIGIFGSALMFWLGRRRRAPEMAEA